jgi:diguanylate cyclase (GGDEF)-like protein/PAS domain S-box-containing protein
MKNPSSSDRYMVTVIVAGAVCVLLAAWNLDPGRVDIYLGLLSIFTIGIGSRVTIQIPRFNSHISVSDTFIFLALLLYGGEYATILAALEAGASAWRFCDRKLTVFFNAAAMAVSTTAVVVVLHLAGLYTQNSLQGYADNRQGFVIALSIIAITQFISNTALASAHRALKDNIPFWETWKTKYIWTFFSYFIGAAAAGALVTMSLILGFGVVLATFPVIFFVFLSYRMYLERVEISMHQVEQAEQYAKILEAQSDALRESEGRFRSAFDYAPIGIGLLSADGRWLKANLALSGMLGYSQEEFLETDFQSITHPEDLGLTLFKVHEVLSGNHGNCQMEQRYIHKSGETVWTSWSVSTSADAQSKQPNLIFQIQDITGKKLAEEKLHYDATHDVLTGLPNRALFMTRLTEALARAAQNPGHNVTVLFIDLDRFKYVNDSLGHLAGDELLREISTRLRECLRQSDLVARLGGDEFTILVEGRHDVREVTRIAEKVQEKFKLPFNVRGHEIFSSASIGILNASEKHLSSEDVMRDADTAMYQAKRAGKARHEIFDEGMHSDAKEILKLETDLRRAVDREEIHVFYQPIFSLETNVIESIEALARWRHRELGDIPPTKFIPLAEELGLIDRVCEQVLSHACRDIGSLRSRPYSLSINLSCRQFSQNVLVHDIFRILAETGFSAHRLRLEITESVFFEHQNRAILTLDQLRSSGIEIDIDDFGTGYSNLGYLKTLPISSLKIDRSFVSMVDGELDNGEIVGAIIMLARNLGLKVIAEGVETQIQLDVLKRLGCESGQGYLFAEPMSFEDLQAFLSGLGRPTRVPPGRVDDIPRPSVLQ